MDTRVRQIVEGFERLLRLTESSFLAKVVSDQGETVTVKDLTDTEYLEVRKSATVGERGLIITPEENSWVIVSRLSNSNDLYISMVSKVASVEIMGGENGGLTITPELKTQLDKLTARVDAIAGVLTTGANGGGTVVFAGMTQLDYVQAMANKEDFSNIENDKITH